MHARHVSIIIDQRPGRASTPSAVDSTVAVAVAPVDDGCLGALEVEVESWVDDWEDATMSLDQAEDMARSVCTKDGVCCA
jgi:hypothetical protein